MQDNEPKGISFFNIKSGETHYAKLEPIIQGYINSSDMGINASHGQDYGWRLSAEWVQKVKDFRRDENKMERLVTRNGGQKPTTTQVLYAIYGEQLRAAQEQADENEAPFEEQYLSDISSKPKATPLEEGAEDANPSQAPDNTPSVSEPVQEVNAASDSNKPANSKTKTAVNKK